MEFAAELRHAAHELVGYGLRGFDPDEDVEIRLIEAAASILPALPERLQKAIERQLRALGVEVALNRAVNRQFPGGIDGQIINLMADNGCQPTALAFTRACAGMGVRQAFTSYNKPKGNADTERFLRTLKEELVWLHEWTSPTVFFEALERWIMTYNAGYLHSALGYRSPEAFEGEHLSHAIPLAAAC